MELIVTLKHAREKTQEAYRNILTREGHTEPLEEAKKAVKLAKVRFSTYLKNKIVFPESHYSFPLWDLLCGVEQSYADFGDGHGWDCLIRARETLDQVIDEIVQAEVVNA